MATTLQILDPADETTIWFDFNDTAGTNHAHIGSVVTHFGIHGAFALGGPEPDLRMISAPSSPGGRVVFSRDPLVMSTWRVRILGSSYDVLQTAVSYLAGLLAAGGVMKWVAHGSSETRYIDFEPSPQPALLTGGDLELMNTQRLFDTPNGVPIAVWRQPYLRGASLAPTVNLLTNSTLLIDSNADGRPNDWTWASASNISAEDIVEDAYRFTIATGDERILQQTTAASTVAQSNVAPFSFYAREVSGGTAKLFARVEYMQADGTTQVGADQDGTLTTLTSAYQRVVVTPAAAGANTSRVRVSIGVNNDDATSVTVDVRLAQAEVAAAVTAYRTGVESVGYDPSAGFGRKFCVWGWGTAPAPAKVAVTSDAVGIRSYRLSRWNDTLTAQATLYAQVEDGTLQAGTASAVDTEAVGDDTAETTYSASAITVGTPTTQSGSLTTLTINKPGSTAEGDFLLAGVYRRGASDYYAGPEGWTLLESVTTEQDKNSAATFASSSFRSSVWWKIAGADEPASYSWLLTEIAAGADSTAGFIQRYANVDRDAPIDSFTVNQEDNSTSPTCNAVTTSQDGDAVVAISMGTRDSTTLTYGAPGGATPTFTERVDLQADVAYRAISMADGVWTSSGDTGNESFSTNNACDSTNYLVALKQAPAALGERARVEFTGVEPGDYDVWLRFRPSAASKQRIRVEAALCLSPAEAQYHAYPDYILDCLTATSFAGYSDRKFGRLHVPDDVTIEGVTIRLSSGLEATSSAKLEMDSVQLVPVSYISHVTSPATLATSEDIYTDPEEGSAYHRDSVDKLLQSVEVAGPTPTTLEPGANWFLLQPFLAEVTGRTDPVTDIDSVPTVAVTYAPRYR